MSNYKRIKIEDGQFTLLQGQDLYQVPIELGDREIWFQWYSEQECTIWLLFKSGLRLPYTSGKQGQFSVQVNDCELLEVHTKKAATVCAACIHSALHRRDNLDYTKAAIAPPPPAQLQMSYLVNAEVKRQLQGLGVYNETLEIDDDDDLEKHDWEDDEEEPFGSGYMDPEAETPRKARVRPTAPDVVPDDPKPSKPDGGSGPEPAAT